MGIHHSKQGTNMTADQIKQKIIDLRNDPASIQDFALDMLDSAANGGLTCPMPTVLSSLLPSWLLYRRLPQCRTTETLWQGFIQRWHLLRKTHSQQRVYDNSVLTFVAQVLGMSVLRYLRSHVSNSLGIGRKVWM